MQMLEMLGMYRFFTFWILTYFLFWLVFVHCKALPKLCRRLQPQRFVNVTNLLQLLFWGKIAIVLYTYFVSGKSYEPLFLVVSILTHSPMFLRLHTNTNPYGMHNLLVLFLAYMVYLHVLGKNVFHVYANSAIDWPSALSFRL